MSPEAGRARVFGTTADMGLAVAAPTLDGLFSTAGEGLASVLCDRRRVRPRETRRVKLEAENLEPLLVAWLDELVYLFDSGRFLPRSCRVQVAAGPGGASLEAGIAGEVYDAARHELRTLVKAATWHRLSVRRAGGRWTARVVLDV